MLVNVLQPWWYKKIHIPKKTPCVSRNLIYLCMCHTPSQVPQPEEDEKCIFNALFIIAMHCLYGFLMIGLLDPFWTQVDREMHITQYVPGGHQGIL